MLNQIIFIIPARGGSKGLPGKNLRLLGGISLLGHAVRVARRAAEKCGLKFRVICSTDDEKIAAEARFWGAEVPRLRPADLATDRADSFAVLRGCVDFLQPDDGDLLVLLQATSPLRELQDVLAAIDLAQKHGDPVLSVCAAEHPAAWQFVVDEQGYMQPLLDKDMLPARRQDAAQALRLNGAIYAVKIKQLIENKGFLSQSSRALIMPVERSVDIDTAQDLLQAQALLDAKEQATVEIDGRKIGGDAPCFVIAEAGVNHNGDIALAKQLIDAAKQAGAAAVKFQRFKAEKLVAPDAPKADYQKRQTGSDESQLDMIRALQLDLNAQRELAEYAKARDILFLSSPFDEDSLDALVALGMPAIKLGSGELTNHFFLRQVAAKGLPMILSTGMADMREVDQALRVVEDAGDPPVILLHCVSSYPTPVDQCNLAAMDSLRRSFGRVTGWSDHTMGVEVSLAAVARGARLIEKHLTLDKNLPGPDHAASAEPQELRQMIEGIRAIEAAIGSSDKKAQVCEINTKKVARRSAHAARLLKRGQVLRAADIQMLRPGTGIEAQHAERLIGQVLQQDVEAGAMLDGSMFADVEAK